MPRNLAKTRRRPTAWAIALALLLAGCTTPMQPRVALPDRHEFARGQLVFHSDVPLPAHHRLVAELTARRVDLSQDLMLPVSDEPIHVYVFEDAQTFDTYLRKYHPASPPRRAFFNESDTRLETYALWGDRVAEDLRHEVTHGYLHSVVPQIPLWLDEGLAEYYELPRGCHGVNPPHLDLLLSQLEQGAWRPDLRRLEVMAPTAVMNQLDYAEAWAWVHWLLHATPPRAEIVREYLRELHREGTARPIWDRVYTGMNDPCAELVAHLGRLAVQRR